MSIQCKACGRRYHYATEGCCPKCGAYNRPPRREIVDADGTVHSLGEKVCYEQKVCFERPPRDVRGKPRASGQARAPQKKAASDNGVVWAQSALNAAPRERNKGQKNPLLMIVSSLTLAALIVWIALSSTRIPNRKIVYPERESEIRAESAVKELPPPDIELIAAEVDRDGSIVLTFIGELDLQCYAVRLYRFYDDTACYPNYIEQWDDGLACEFPEGYCKEKFTLADYDVEIEDITTGVIVRTMSPAS